jgi:hypothetical protein
MNTSQITHDVPLKKKKKKKKKKKNKNKKKLLTHAAKVLASCSSWPRDPGWALAQVWNLQSNCYTDGPTVVEKNKRRGPKQAARSPRVR